VALSIKPHSGKVGVFVPKVKEKTVAVDDHYELMLISAVRYALGRRTYIVAETARYVSGKLWMVKDATLMVMLRDIDERIAWSDRSGMSGLGDECDRAEWMLLRKAIIDEIGKRGAK